MKRTSTAAELDGATFHRQQPISCAFCRKRKLKCGRENPCGNCVTRGMRCLPAAKPSVKTSQQSSQRLSDVLPSGGDGLSQKPPGETVQQSARQVEHSRQQQTSQRRSDIIPGVGNVLSQTRALGIPTTPDDSSINTRQGRSVALDTNNENDLNRQALQFEADATQLQDTPASWPTVNIMFPSTAPRRHGATITLVEVLQVMPSRARAHRLLDHFIDNLQWSLHICHTPSLRRSLGKLYGDLESGVHDNLRDLALHSAILGVSAAYPSKTLSLPEEVTTVLAQSLTQLAQRALVEVDYLKNPSLTTLQAALILGYMIVPEAGGLTTVLLALRAAIHCAQALGMHRLDSPRFVKQRGKEGSTDYVYLELQRRIYWQLAASDWLISTVSGPYTSTYFIHPDQFQVQLPANCDDEALDAEGVYSRPCDVPTEQSHTLIRVGLASMYREVVDTANRQGVEVHELDYETVQQIDAKFVAFIEDLPYFLKMDHESRARSRAIDKRMPFLAWSRAGTLCAWHMRRIQIHRRWLIPSSDSPDAPCARSREICLSAARAVVALEQEMYETVMNHVPNFSRHWAVVHHLLVASLVLGMEYARGDASIRPELLNCCHALARSQETSTIAWKGLQQLQCILRRWSRNEDAQQPMELASAVQPIPRNEGADTTPFMGVVPDLSSMPTDTNAGVHEWLSGSRTVHEAPAADNAIFGDIFNDLWLNTMDLPTGLESSEWDALFQEL